MDPAQKNRLQASLPCYAQEGLALLERNCYTCQLNSTERRSNNLLAEALSKDRQHLSSH